MKKRVDVSAGQSTGGVAAEKHSLQEFKVKRGPRKKMHNCIRHRAITDATFAGTRDKLNNRT